MFRKGFTAVFVREVRRIFTIKDLFLICLIAPLAYGAVLSSVYYSHRVQKVAVGVVDDDRTQLARTFVRYADATENIRIAGRYADPEAATRAILEGRIAGFLYIPRDFSSQIKQGQDAYSLLSIDASNFLLSNPVMQSLTEVAGTLSAGILTDHLRKTGAGGARARTVTQPVLLDARIVYNPQLNYSHFFLPGLMLVIIQQVMLIGIGFSVVDEREELRGGEMFLLAGRNYLALLLGKLLPYVMLNLVLGILFVFGVLPLYGIAAQGNVPGIILFMALFIGATSAFGFMLASCFRNVVMVYTVLMFYSMPTFLFSGFSWPAYALPLPVRLLSYLFPSTYSLESFRLMVLGGVPFATVLPNAAALVVFNLACLTATFVIFRRIFRFDEKTGNH